MGVRNPCIYAIRNILNDKKYIGQTLRKFEYRKNDHLRKLRDGTHNNKYLQSTFDKYGEGNLEFSVLEFCEEEVIDEREIFWINNYNSNDRNYGYNMDGGGRKNKVVSEETIKKLSKMVICLEDMNIFNSGKEASLFYGVSYGGLNNVLRRKSQACKNKEGELLRFDYYEPSKKVVKKKLDSSKIFNSTKVLCVNTGETYVSLGEAERHTGFHKSKISLVCNGKRGYHGKDERGNPIKWEFV